jgi:hypothetical protein
MTPQQVAVFIEERKWDYWRTSPIILFFYLMTNKEIQSSGSLQPFSKVSPSSDSYLHCQIEWGPLCGHTVCHLPRRFV